MHIEFVTDTYPPDVNGAAKTLKYLVICLRKAGHHVTLIGPHPESVLKIASFRVPKDAGVSLGLVRKCRLKSWWQENRPDVVYVAGEAFLGCSAIKAAAELGIPTIAGYHTNYSQYASNWRLKFLAKPAIRHMRKFHNRASTTVVPSTSVMKELSTQGFPEVHVIGRGVDTGLFHPSKRSDQQRAEWGASSDSPVAIFVARISSEKNLVLLKKSFQKLQELNPRTRCVLVGDGPSFKRFQRENSNVICYRFKHGEELAQIYASADILVFPSMTETFGNTVTEALASGLVVVAYDYAAAQMHIENQVNGFLVEYGEEDAFLEVCGRSLEFAFDRTLRDAAHASMSAVTWELVAERFLHIAEGLVE